MPTTSDHPAEPTWIAAEDMANMPRAWYWAAYPGGWVWFSPERVACLAIDHGDTGWHALISGRYWGPWYGPEGQQPKKVDLPPPPPEMIEAFKPAALSERQALEIIARLVDKQIKRPPMPVAVSDMTEREHILFKEQIAPMSAAMMYMREILERAGVMLPSPSEAGSPDDKDNA